MATLERFEKFKEISRVNVEKVWTCTYVCMYNQCYIFCIYIVYMCVGILGVWQ